MNPIPKRLLELLWLAEYLAPIDSKGRAIAEGLFWEHVVATEWKRSL